MILERGAKRTRRALVQVLPPAEPRPGSRELSVRPINSRQTYRVPPDALEPLAQEDQDALVEIGPISEPELANAIAMATAFGCSVGDVKWRRSRGGALLGERRGTVQREYGSPARAIRLGKRCATPGCTFLDFHECPCSHELELEPRARKRKS
jgi:hypothetical protein